MPTSATTEADATGAVIIADLQSRFSSANADVFNGTSWDNGVPGPQNHAIIANGGTGTATAGGPLEVFQLTVGDVVNGGNGTLTLDGVDVDIERDLNIAGTRRVASDGDQTVVGDVTVRNASRFEVTDPSQSWDVNIGVRGGAGQTVNADGTLTIDNVTTVNLGSDVFAGRIRALDSTASSLSEYGDADLTSNATISVTNAGSFDVFEDLELARVEGGTSTAGADLNAIGQLTLRNITAAPVSIDGDFDVAVNNAAANGGFAGAAATNAVVNLSQIDTVIIDEDLEIAKSNVAARVSSITPLSFTGTVTSEAQFAVSDIGSMSIAEDLEVGFISARNSDLFSAGSAVFSGTASSNGQASFSNVNNLSVFEDIDIGLLSLFEETSLPINGQLSSTGAITLTNVAAAVTSDDGRTRVGVLDDRSISPITGATISTEGTLQMTNSSLTTPNLIVGTKTTGTVGAVSGVVELNPSIIVTDDLTLGEGGDLIFHLEGTNRVSLGTVGEEDSYSAIDAFDALLAGEIIAEFDFIPSAGTHIFDLIVTDGSTDLDDATMVAGDFQVRDLSAGFAVDSFGIVEDNGVDIVRLQISGVPVLPGDYNGDGNVDGFDFLTWQRNPSIGALSDWQANYGISSPPPVSTVTVPEPTTVVMLGLSIGLVATRRPTL